MRRAGCESVAIGSKPVFVAGQVAWDEAWPPADIAPALDDTSEIDSDFEEVMDGKGNLITDAYVADAIADVHRALDEGRVPVGSAEVEGR
jgi:hypothetical protein